MNQLLLRRRFVEQAGVTPVYPFDSKVEYLQSTGTQYIDTGIVVQENDIIEVEAMFLTVASSVNYLFGANGFSGEGSISVYYWKDYRLYFRYGYSSSSYKEIAVLNAWKTYKIEKGKFYIDNQDLNFTLNFTSTPSRSLFIFGNNAATPTGGIMKIKTSKIIRNGSPVLNMIPVRVGTTGYMYDKVSGTLFGNDGTGSFGIGNDIT